MTLLDRLRAAVPEPRRKARALTAPDACVTWDDLIAKAEGTADLLRRQGVGPGDRVVYLGYNSAAIILALFGAARVGAILCPFNWRLAEEELAWQVGHCDPALLIADTAHAGIAERIAGGRPVCAAQGIADVDGGTAPEPVADHSDAPLLLVYTSGTTGRPKGAVLSQDAVLANARLSWDMHGMTPSDHVLTALPMFHVGGLNIQTVPAILCGARVTLMDRFEPGVCLSAISAHRPTLTVQVPATFQALMAHPDWSGTDLSSLRAIATGSTDVPVALIEAMHARAVPVIQIYGATETGPVVIYQKIADAGRVGTIGRPGPGVTVRIASPDGTEQPVDTPGEIWLRAPTLARGYWRNREADEVFTEGWFRTGDVARRDAEGFYWFTDRIKNVIISGGENIYPAELERVLNETTGVREAAVVGRTDARWGTVPVAVVAGAADLTRDAVLAAFEGRIARFKHPKDVVFVDALPRNAMGKVVSEALRTLV